ncbi:MAG TPA: class I SAM-dependent methyltransferase [Polyangiaceae bacterium]|nr:class I SAM-dependent methyltransferase [Polyangiaceae bacterium]
MMTSELQFSQLNRYRGFYGDWVALGNRLRFDVRYRCRRLPEVLRQLQIPRSGRRVLDIGFATGDLLATFPENCAIWGVDVSPSAIACAEHSVQLSKFSQRRFSLVQEESPWELPAAQFDIVLSSHTLEHVSDDLRVLKAAYDRLAPGGTLALFVPLEEPDYILFHLRNYSLQSITERVRQAGFTVRHVEGSMYINGHIWKLLTIPSRRNWPILKHLVDALRMIILGILPYPAMRFFDSLLYHLGVDARQALVIAEKPKK